MKKCTKCGNMKEESEYYKDSRRPDGLYSQCKECHKCNSSRNYREKRKEKKKRIEEWREDNPGYFKEYFSRPENIARYRLTKKLNENFSGRHGYDVKKITGLSEEEFKKYMEKQFQDGMSWDNYGEWHIDHIVPCASFDLNKSHHVEECFYYTNLQPLWAEDNRRKSNKEGYEIN